MAPVFQGMALTPEKMPEMNRDCKICPLLKSVAAKKRERRESKLFAEDEREAKANLARVQAGCAHRYPTGASSCQIVRNFPDRQPRAFCNFCQCG